MTPNPSPSGAPPVFEPDRLYRIKVASIVTHGSLRITPKNGGTVTGAVAEIIQNEIVSYERVE